MMNHDEPLRLKGDGERNVLTEANLEQTGTVLSRPERFLFLVGTVFNSFISKGKKSRVIARPLSHDILALGFAFRRILNLLPYCGWQELDQGAEGEGS